VDVARFCGVGTTTAVTSTIILLGLSAWLYLLWRAIRFSQREQNARASRASAQSQPSGSTASPDPGNVSNLREPEHNQTVRLPAWLAGTGIIFAVCVFLCTAASVVHNLSTMEWQYRLNCGLRQLKVAFNLASGPSLLSPQERQLAFVTNPGSSAQHLPEASQERSTRKTSWPLQIVSQTASKQKNLRHPRWLLLVDALDLGHARHRQAFGNLLISVNGKMVHDRLRPLWSVDSSTREYFVYLRSFASCAGTNPDQFRQWWCLDVPGELIKKNRINSVEFYLTDTDVSGRCLIFGDYAGKANYHTLSPRYFSWVKGFFADTPGESRLSLSLPKEAGSRSDLIIPRVIIVRVDERRENIDVADTSDRSIPAHRIISTEIKSSPHTRISLPTGKIGNRRENSLLIYDLNGARWDRLSQARSSAVCIAVAGECRCPSGSGIASLSMIETLDDGAVSVPEVAPTPPDYMEVSQRWQSFAFEDICPLIRVDARSRHADQLRQFSLAGLRIICAGSSWWDVLAYGQYQARKPVEFRNLSVAISPIDQLDLERASCDIYRAEPLSAIRSERPPAANTD